MSPEHVVSMSSIYAWKSKYARLEVSQLKRLKEFEEENRWMKTPLVHLSFDMGA